MPLLYRGAVVNSIWEGSGNVAALDVLRAIVRQPDALTAFIDECELALGADPRLDAHLGRLRARLDEMLGQDGGNAPAAEARLSEGRTQPEFHARRVVEELALALAGSLLVRHSRHAVADAFCAARLGRDSGRAYGTLPAGVDATAIIERSLPERG
jgi:putative acyl-CoA dehydrogenase